MRKEKLVTRNFDRKFVNVLGYNTETSETETRKFEIPTKLADEKKIMKHITNLLESDGITDYVPVKILETEHKPELRAMPESKFIENSYIIANRNNANEVKPN